ncbi:hypothetical protein [Streptomyces mutabilis]|uniref:Uncharacterized protein n=1 Tax=Streptomyces mutabilis TaxID=67332 RepID=A0A086MR11_9ACTN|nr:hypothetical protein [Streptomyces mutabilis]KFG71329.1 hypothetical protein FM21_34020 [Streptomyces mutabilis]
MSVRHLTERVELPLPGIGSAAARVTVLEQGRVRYVVRAPHVHGTFVVVPEHIANGPILPTTVAVQFGDGAEPLGSFYREHRPDEPVVHGVRVHGWTEHLHPDDLPTGWFLGRYASGLSNGIHRELARGTRRRTEAVILAIVTHWRSLPYRRDLMVTAAREKAAEYAEHEGNLAAAAEAQAVELARERRAVRHRLCVLAGILRRRPRPVQAPQAELVQLQIEDPRRGPLGRITVREVAVNTEVAGSVVYEVTGPRVLGGRFTVGPNRYRPEPIPKGIWVAYGHASDRYYEDERAHAPVVNGVRLCGQWDHNTSDDITATTPDTIGARVPSRGSAPYATERRTAAVVRALALHYLRRPDLEALRLAAAQANVPSLRADARRQLSEVKKQLVIEERNARRHRARERELRSLVPGTPREDLSAEAA